jgi:hypothetical protein
MGAITGAFNQAAGAVAGAAVAIKHASQQKELKAEAAREREEKDIEQGLLAKEQYHRASADLNKLTGESAEVKDVLNKANSAVEVAMAKKPGGKGNTRAAIAEGQKKALTEQDAAQRAFDELADRIEAKKAIIARAEAIMRRTNT